MKIKTHALFLLILLFPMSVYPGYVMLDTNTVKEGGVVKVKIGVEAPLKASEIRFMEEKYPVFFRKYEPVSREYIYMAVVPVPLGTQGRKVMKVRYFSSEGGKTEKKEYINIRPMKSEESLIQTGGKVFSLGKYLREENIRISEAQDEITPVKFDFPFLRPVTGRLSSPFGKKRVYDDGSVGWRHKGMDLASPSGTEIKAANNGTVKLAEDMKGHGKTIVIDHGGGVYSLYEHMSEIYVDKDVVVKKGDIIGAVGSTGISTGPHLHWQMNVFKEPVNPGDFMTEF
ncbi:MAG: M23 family metallopeptidase [Candidatus Goldiibacteriota bacterium]